MEKASKALRRSGAKLKALGSGGYSELSLVMSEYNDVRTATKTLTASQSSATQELMNWAASEENRAIQDVVSQMAELNLLWSEAQRQFADQFREFREVFSRMLEDQRSLDHLQASLSACEQREAKLKKDLKKAAKKSSADELRQLENKVSQAERAKDLARLEFDGRRLENEAVKTIRFKEGLMRLSDAYIVLGQRCTVIHEAQKDVANQVPDVHEQKIEDIKYSGFGTTRHCVAQAREDVKLCCREAVQRQANAEDVDVPTNAGRTRSKSASSSVRFDSLPPPYSPGCFIGRPSSIGVRNCLENFNRSPMAVANAPALEDLSTASTLMAGAEALSRIEDSPDHLLSSSSSGYASGSPPSLPATNDYARLLAEAVAVSQNLDGSYLPHAALAEPPAALMVATSPCLDRPLEHQVLYRNITATSTPLRRQTSSEGGSRRLARQCSNASQQ